MTDTHADTHTDTQTQRQTNRQTDRQTDKPSGWVKNIIPFFEGIKSYKAKRNGVWDGDARWFLKIPL